MKTTAARINRRSSMGSTICFRCLPLFLTVLVGSSCASFTHRIASSAAIEERSALAGATLACAGEASRTALMMTLLSGGASAGASIAGGLAAASVDPSFRTFMALASLGLAAGSFTAAVASLIFMWDAAAYTEQAGSVLAGHESLGSCRSQPPPRVHRAPPPRRKRARRVPRRPKTGALAGRCYGNDTCDAGLTCVAGACVAPAAGTLGGACYGNQTCNPGLTCGEDGQCVNDDQAVPRTDPSARPPDDTRDSEDAAEQRRVLPVE